MTGAGSIAALYVSKQAFQSAESAESGDGADRSRVTQLRGDCKPP